MNKARRNRIYGIIKRLQSIDPNNVSFDEIVDIAEDVQIVLDDEECYMENIPENLQYSERYEKAEEACDNLSDACYILEDLCEADEDCDFEKMIKEVVNLLDNATA